MTDARWVLFDLDGTLLDYDTCEREAVAATLADAGVDPTAEVIGTYRRINARHWRALERGETTAARLRRERWEEVLAAHGLGEVDVDGLAERYLGHLAAGSHLVEGAEEVVAAVADAYPVAYITNGLADVQRPRIDASPLAAYTDVMIISDEVGVAKPHPAIFEAALDGLGAPPRDRTIMVGDNLVADIGGAAQIGMQTVWLAGPDVPTPEVGGPVPTHRISDLRELPGLLGLTA